MNYKNIIKEAPFGYAYHKVLFDKKGAPVDYVFLEINDQFKVITSLTDEIIGKKVTDVIPGILNSKFDWITCYGEISLTGVAKEFEQHSEIFKKHFKVTVTSDKKGYFTTFFSDITLMAKRNSLLMQLSNNIPGFVYQYRLHLDGRNYFPYASKNIQQIYELTPEEVCTDASNVLSRLHPDDYNRVVEKIKQSAQNLSVWDDLYRVILPQKGERWISGVAKPERLDDQSVLWHGYLADVTEKQTQSQQLVETTERYNLAIDGSNDGIWDWDLKTNNLFLSKRWKEMVGYLDDELENNFSTFEKLLHVDDKLMVLSEVEKYLKGQIDIYKIEFRFQHKDGHYRWILAKGKSIRDSAGNIVRMAGSHSDITEQRQFHNKLLQSESNFRTFFETIDDLIIIGDVQGKVYFANDAMIRKLGYSFDELKKMHILDLHFDHQRLEAENIFNEMFTGSRSSCPLPLKMKNGKALPVETRVWFGKWDSNDAVFGVIKDLSKEQDTLQMFNKIFDNNPALMALSLLPERKFINVNDAFLTKLGYLKEDVVGKCATDLNLFSDPSAQAQISQELNQLGSIRDKELEIITKNGNKLIGLFSGEVIHTHKNDYFLTVMIDITDRVELTKQLESTIYKAHELANAAEYASLAKSQFLANMGHEIRTPMNSIIVMAQLLANSNLNTDQKKYANAIVSSGDALLSLTNDILDYSKIEAGKLELEEENFDLAVMVRDITYGFELRIREKDVKFIYHPIETSIPVLGDQYRIRQIINNLLSNAVKFTEKGEIELSLNVEQTNDGKKLKLNFVVRDTGVGIPADKLGILFNKFSQIDSSITRRYGGTGLGLAICKQLVEMMSGSIGVKSSKVGGSVFSFDIVVKSGSINKFIQKQEIISDFIVAKDISGTILLVEDNVTNIEVIKTVLEPYGNIKIVFATNGVEAIERYNSHKVDMILMDLQMPVMDGYEATESIRTNDSSLNSKNIPIVGLSANSSVDERKKCLAIGMNDFIEKPIHVIRFLEKINHWLLQSSNNGDLLDVIEELDKKITENNNINLHFDELNFLERIHNEEKLAKRIIQIFLNDIPSKLTELKELIDKNDKQNIEIVAHGIKGACMNISANNMRDVAYDIEKNIYKWKLDQMLVAMINLENSFVELREILNKRYV